MDYHSVVTQINIIKNENCFRRAETSSIQYLQELGLSIKIIEFYQQYEPKDIIEIEGIRLLPISEIMEENLNYTPGYLLSPHGYCAIASTIEGDVYFINTGERDVIVLASHDEIHEGLKIEDLEKKARKIAMDFFEFLAAYKNGELPKSFYDLK